VDELNRRHAVWATVSGGPTVRIWGGKTTSSEGQRFLL